MKSRVRLNEGYFWVKWR